MLAVRRGGRKGEEGGSWSDEVSTRTRKDAGAFCVSPQSTPPAVPPSRSTVLHAPNEQAQQAYGGVWPAAAEPNMMRRTTVQHL